MDETNKLIFVTNKAVLRMRNIRLSQDESEDEIEKSEDEYYEEWPDDWDETEDESHKEDDLITSSHQCQPAQALEARNKREKTVMTETRREIKIKIRINIITDREVFE